MFAVRVMLGGNIFIVRVIDNQTTLYNEDGKPVWGHLNKLQLEPDQVLQLANEAERNWVLEHFRK